MVGILFQSLGADDARVDAVIVSSDVLYDERPVIGALVIVG